MKKYGIIYGSSTGTTAHVAEMIAEQVGVDKNDVHDVKGVNIEALGEYKVLILGTSTWGSGELQDDWYDLVAGVGALDLSDKKIALFGCGDESMTETFCDGLADLRDKLLLTGATFIGAFNADGYDFNHSRSQLEDGQMIGLVIDDVNRPELTEIRVGRWCKMIMKECE